MPANGKLRILVKAQPTPQAPGHCHQLGLAYYRATLIATEFVATMFVRLCVYTGDVINSSCSCVSWHSVRMSFISSCSMPSVAE